MGQQAYGGVQALVSENPCFAVTRRQGCEGFYPGSHFPVSSWMSASVFFQGILATTGGHPTGKTCQDPAQWRLAEAFGGGGTH